MPLALLALVAAELAQMQQRVQHDPFAHARGEVGVDDAHDRNLRQARVLEQMIDAGAEREDRLEIGQAGERAGLVPPADGVADGGAVGQRLRRHDRDGRAEARAGAAARAPASHPVAANRMAHAPALGDARDDRIGRRRRRGADPIGGPQALGGGERARFVAGVNERERR